MLSPPNKGYDVSIDIEKLADSLSGEMGSLHPLARECSIYRVPETTRCFHPSHFTPRIVSIGPFHHGETIHLESDEFIKMVFVDGVFLIELFLKYYQPNLRTNEDPILGKSYCMMM